MQDRSVQCSKQIYAQHSEVFRNEQGGAQHAVLFNKIFLIINWSGTRSTSQIDDS